MAYVNATVGSNTAKVTSVTDGTNTLATLAAVVENDSNLTVTANGTYNATQDGFAKVIVNVASAVSGGQTMNCKTGACNFSEYFKIEHGCGVKPKFIIFIIDDYSSITPTLNKTAFAIYIDGVGSTAIVSSNTVMWNACYMQNMGDYANAVGDDDRKGIKVDETFIEWKPVLSNYDAAATWYAFY